LKKKGLPTLKFLYLHGFASGPGSRKALAFREKLNSRGVDLLVPALDGSDFAHLTITGQLKIMEGVLKNQPAHLIGSSMGSYLAALYASLHPEIGKLILMAPAFRFAQRWRAKLPPGEDFEVFHYGEKTMRRVHYGLIEDSLRYPGVPDFRQPALIFHGKADDVVPIDYSRAFAATHPNAELIEMDSDHELLNVLDEITSRAPDFLLAH
jgi:pimeloyl-ACP methyl ester carboxylesterase